MVDDNCVGTSPFSRCHPCAGPKWDHETAFQITAHKTDGVLCGPGVVNVCEECHCYFDWWCGGLVKLGPVYWVGDTVELEAADEF